MSNAPLKVVTLNVNGIRAAFRKGMVDWLREARPDILCLQEVRAADEDILGLFRPGEHGSTFGGNPVAAAAADGSTAKFTRRVFSATERAVWTRQLAGLVSSGLPLERALTALAEKNLRVVTLAELETADPELAATRSSRSTSRSPSPWSSPSPSLS
mgnify:CR=1 FL=1